MITFTLYAHARATAGEHITRTWEQWADALTEHDHRQSKDGPAIVLGLVDGPRKAAHVVSLHAIGADLDDMADDEIERVLSIAERYTHVAWTTHSHGAPGKGSRWRVLFPFAEPADPKDAKRLHLGLDALLGGGVLDPKTKDAGRLFYLPSVPADLEHLAISFDHDGPHLAPADLLAAVPAAPVVVERRTGLSPDLETLRQALSKLPRGHPLKPSIKAMLAGESFAPAGESHDRVLAITGLIAQKRDTLSDDDVGALFDRSIAAMQEAGSSITIEETITAYVGAVDRLVDWRDAAATERTQQAQQQQAGATGPYTDSDLQRIAAGAGCSPDDLADRWILQRDGRVYLLDEDGGYRGPYPRDDCQLAAARVLARAPVRLIEATETGPRRRAWLDITIDYGAALDSEVASFVASRTRYEQDTHTLHHAPCPLRPLAPQHDPQIAEWLDVVAGPSKLAALLDWLAVCPDLNRLLCALYLEGAPASGKTLLAVGLARLWTEASPTPLQEIVGSFSEHLLRCPLVLADEEIKTPFGSSTVTAQIRSMISQHTHTITRKHLKPLEAHGALRIVLAANHDGLLKSADVATEDDLRAIAERFLHIKIGEDATAYLRTLPAGTAAGWARDGIARHALALAQSRDVPDTGERFAVSGVVDEMHRTLAFGSRYNAQVCEWLVGYVNHPVPYDRTSKGLVFIEGGSLFVNTSALVSSWALYMKHIKDIPDTATIAAAIRTFAADGGRTYRRKVGDKTPSFRRVNTETLIAWAKRNGVGDVDTMRATLTANTPEPEPGKVVKLHG